MQPNDSFSVPRRALDVEDYIDIVRRHQGWIFGPFLLCVVASVVGVYFWPDSYLSEARIKIVPQSLPESMVQSSVQQLMTDRISSMENDILSRTTLTTIIKNFGLYQKELSSQPIDDVVEEMRKKIKVTLLAPEGSRTAPAFSIQYYYQDRHQAQRVVQDLVSRFLDEHTSNQSTHAFNATQFMQSELDQSQKELDAIENKLTTFKTANNGRLPDQAEGNVRQLQAAQSQVMLVDSSISRANQERLRLENEEKIYKDRRDALIKESKETPEQFLTQQQQQKDPKLIEAENEVSSYEKSLVVLKQKYTDNNPDVQATKSLLEQAKHKRDELQGQDAAKREAAKEEAKNEPAAPRPRNPQAARELLDLNDNIKRLQSSIEAKDVEMAEYKKDGERLEESIKIYNARMGELPLGERQYGDLLRDKDLARTKFVEAQTKLDRAKLGQEMEEKRQGELLEQLDPASLPTSVATPNRPLTIAIGAGVGLLLGFVIAGAREIKDASLKNLKDVRAYTQMAILGSIPLLENDFVVRRRKRLAWLGWTSACLAAAVVVSGSIVYYYVTKQ